MQSDAGMQSLQTVTPGGSGPTRRRYLLTGALALVALALSPAGAVAPLSQAQAGPAALAPTASQVKATSLITRIIDKQHYLNVSLDDAFSSRVFERYLENLDPNRSYFLAEDVARMSRYRDKLDDALRQARLDAAYQIFAVYRARLGERARQALALLDGPFDFTRDEDFRIDRKNAPWPRDRKELDEVWRQRVKNDVLNLMLAGRTQKEAERTLRRRYEALARRAEQFNAEDVFQIFMNAYAGSIEPHTAYLSPRNSENFQIQLSLSLEGIGAALQGEDEYTVVQRVIPGGPASLSGQLQAQDRVTAVGQGPDGLRPRACRHGGRHARGGPHHPACPPWGGRGGLGRRRSFAARASAWRRRPWWPRHGGRLRQHAGRALRACGRCVPAWSACPCPGGPGGRGVRQAAWRW